MLQAIREFAFLSIYYKFYKKISHVRHPAQEVREENKEIWVKL